MNIAMDLIREALLGGSGGGGGGGAELIISDELEVSTTSTSAVLEKEWDITDNTSIDFLEPAVYYYVRIRDKAGLRNGYFGGSDDLVLSKAAVTGESAYGIFTSVRWGCRILNGTAYSVTNTLGVYGDFSVSTTSRKFRVYSKYSTSSSTIDGTFTVEVYKIPAIGGKLY